MFLNIEEKKDKVEGKESASGRISLLLGQLTLKKVGEMSDSEFSGSINNVESDQEF